MVVDMLYVVVNYVSNPYCTFDNVPIHRNIYIFLNKATASISDF